MNTKNMPPGLARYWRSRRAKSGKKKRANPRPIFHTIVAKRGKTRMVFDGEHFSTGQVRAKLFNTAADAVKRARSLMKQHPVLRGYKLYVTSG